MSKLRTMVLFMLGGALVGVVAASIVVPPLIAWYNTPAPNSGVQTTQFIDTRAVIHYATGQLIKGQLIGALIGAVVFLIIGFLVLRGRGHKPQNTSGTVVPPRTP